MFFYRIWMDAKRCWKICFVLFQFKWWSRIKIKQTVNHHDWLTRRLFNKSVISLWKALIGGNILLKTLINFFQRISNKKLQSIYLERDLHKKDFLGNKIWSWSSNIHTFYSASINSSPFAYLRNLRNLFTYLYSILSTHIINFSRGGKFSSIFNEKVLMKATVTSYILKNSCCFYHYFRLQCCFWPINSWW